MQSHRMLGLVIAALVAGCSNQTQLVVSVDTDYDVPRSIDRISIEVTGPSGTTRTAEQALEGRGRLPLTLTVVPSADALGPVDIRAIGWSGETRVTTQDARVTLEAGRSLSLRLFLGQVCDGVSCRDGSETCLCGECVPSDAMPAEWSGDARPGDPCLDTPDAGAMMDGGAGDDAGPRDGGALDAAPMGCTSDAECDDSIECTSDACTDSVCVNTPTDASCTDGTGGACVVGFGCQYDGCSPSTCVAGPCQTSRCDGDTCVLEPACGSGEECCGDVCVATGCDDGNPCTDDMCGAAGCEHANNTASCDDGTFCNGGDTCAAGACTGHAGDPCGGASVCDESMNSCTGCLNDSDCPDAIVGPWGSCSYSGQCAESGSRERTNTTYACMSGVCQPSATMESGSCSRSTGGDSCGSTTFGGWGSCGGFSGMCDESGTRSRTRTDRECSGGVCADANSTDSGSCARDTDGDGCGTTEYGGWGSCGGYADACDESGTRSRSETTYACATGSCRSTVGTDSGSCSRDTDGDSCGATEYGTWSACGGFSGTCDDTGTRSRGVTDYACATGTCGTTSGSESEACNRTTDGTSCGTTMYGPWSSCIYSDGCDERGTRSRQETTYSCAGGMCDSTVGTDTDSTACTRDTEGDFCSDFSTCRIGECAVGSCDYTAPGCPPRDCCEPGYCSTGGLACP